MDPVRGTSNSPGSSPANSPTTRRRPSLTQSAETPLTGPVEGAVGGAVGGTSSAQILASLAGYSNDTLKEAAETSFELSHSGDINNYDYDATRKCLYNRSNTCSEACLAFIHQFFHSTSHFHPVDPYAPAHLESIDLSAALDRAPEPAEKKECENTNEQNFIALLDNLKVNQPYIMRVGALHHGHHVVVYKSLDGECCVYNPSIDATNTTPRYIYAKLETKELSQSACDLFHLETEQTPIHAYEITPGNLSFLSHFCKVHRCQSEVQAEAAFPLPRPAGASPEPEADKARRLVALSNAQFSPEVLFSDVLHLPSQPIPKKNLSEAECIFELQKDDLIEIQNAENAAIIESPAIEEQIRSATNTTLEKLKEKKYSHEAINTKKAQMRMAPPSLEDLHSHLLTLASTNSTPTLHLVLKENRFGVKELCLLSLSKNRWELFTKEGLIPLLMTGKPPNLSPFTEMKLQIATLKPGHLQTLENIHTSNGSRNGALNTHKAKEIEERTKDIQARQESLIATQTIQPRGEGPDNEAENVELVAKYIKEEEERKRAEGAQGIRPGTTASAAIDFSPFNNTCSEESLLCAALHYGFQVPSFDLRNYTSDNKINSDVQLELGNALGTLNINKINLETKDIAQNGKNKEGIVGFLNSLNKNLCHLVRTGKNGGAGHFSVLYFKNGEWWNHENRNQTVQRITNSEGQLTEEGEQKFVVAHGSWGRKSDEYNLVVTPFPKDKDVFLKLTQFINMSRQCTDDVSRSDILAMLMEQFE